VDKMLVILPFEEAFYKSEGVEVEYIGHPLVECVQVTASREEFCGKNGLDANRSMIALLPGSRQKEIHYHLPEMLDAAKRLRDWAANPTATIRYPQFVLPLASTVKREQVEPAVQAAGVDVVIIERDTYNVIGHADFAIVASGTATVETALTGTPMLIVYRGSEVNWRLIRPLINLDTFGMVNLIAGRRIVPELIQHECTGERIAAEAQAILSNAGRLATMREDLQMVRERLQTAGSVPGRAAQAIMQVIQGEDVAIR
jgi:lipid-A-disaccharide synthase